MMRIPPWEFWPYPLVYSGIFAYYSTQAIRYGHPAWFSAVNPGIPYGGLYGYSKAQVLKMLPREYVPPFVLVPGGSSVDDTLLKAHDLKFPLIVKPDVGERGIGVEKVKSLTELQEILQEAKHPQIVQHCIQAEKEYGILCARIPGTTGWTVTSITKKEFLRVQGDGKQTIGELIHSDSRKRRYAYRFQENQLLATPASGEPVELEPIGNHNRGTTFINAQERIDKAISERMNRLFDLIEGINYGRMDLRAHSWEALLDGQFEIIELNGVASEPAHIYSPGFPFLEGQKCLLWHWKLLSKIAGEQIRKGVSLPPIMQTFKDFALYRQKIKAV